MRSKGRILGCLGLAAAALGTLVGCGGSSGGVSNPTLLSGTAATGAGMVGTITAVDSNGIQRTVRSAADGSYSIDTQGMTPKFLIRAVPDNGGPTLYSFSDASGNITVNITPLTNLALFLTFGKQDLDRLFRNWITLGTGITEADITKKQAVINQNLSAELQAQGIDPTTYDFFNEPFNANSTGFDAVLDGLDVELQPGGGFRVARRGGAALPFDENVDTSGINLNPGAPGTGGAPPIGANETPATIPTSLHGQYALTFQQGMGSTGGPYTNGQKVTFTVGAGTLSFGGKTLTTPVLRNGNPQEAIWKDTQAGVEYALSSLTKVFNEINVGGLGGAPFYGQFPSPQKMKM